eukprot:CAMPEP_0116894216 /NCGR_PEP_ID=MMETSP0467-20121206/4046_1 /TAXON_ID=283647 /ORGANISM="Mesodinium pulex, Strain SPMC105" /LENGTH=90 /DNA_ID=CAMNT_0004564337 /DNA_START=467 /DNA_END=738 /DNA_ORIENTATION=+
MNMAAAQDVACVESFDSQAQFFYLDTLVLVDYFHAFDGHVDVGLREQRIVAVIFAQGVLTGDFDEVVEEVFIDGFGRVGGEHPPAVLDTN